MKLEKFLGSKTKVDIIKYLIFKRQGISIRALESELNWSFPAIKKQVDSLEEAEIVEIDKNNNRFAITIRENVYDLIKNFILFNLEQDFVNTFNKYDTMLDKFYLGKIFGKKLDIDIVLLHKNTPKEFLEQIKNDFEKMFKDYFIDHLSVVFMSVDDFQRRYRLADKFILNLITNSK